MGGEAVNPKAVWTCFLEKKSSKTPLAPSAHRTVIVCARRTDQEIDKSSVLFKEHGNVRNQRS